MESAGTSTDEIKVDLRLSVLKALQATWLVSLYNHLTGSMGKAIWKTLEKINWIEMDKSE